MAYRRIVVRLVTIALPLNLAWELLQAPAFGTMGDTWLKGFLVCAVAAVGDGVIALLLFGAGVAAFRQRRWFAPFRPGRYLGIIAIAVFIQVAVEWVALVQGRWSYQPWHPTLLGIGLLPVLQAVVVVPLMFWLLSRWDGTPPTGLDTHP